MSNRRSGVGMIEAAGQTVQVAVNGALTPVPSGLTILSLLEHLAVQPERVAVELNRVIVPQNHWKDTIVPPNSQIEIVQFVGGG